MQGYFKNNLIETKNKKSDGNNDTILCKGRKIKESDFFKPN